MHRKLISSAANVQPIKIVCSTISSPCRPINYAIFRLLRHKATSKPNMVFNKGALKLTAVRFYTANSLYIQPYNVLFVPPTLFDS